MRPVEGNPAPRWTAPRSTPCPAPISAMSLTGTPLLGRDSTGAYVLQLQRLLSVTPVTGFFGPITEAALIAFQKAHGLSATGTTTPATWAAVRSAAPAAAPAPTTQTGGRRPLAAVRDALPRPRAATR